MTKTSCDVRVVAKEQRKSVRSPKMHLSKFALPFSFLHNISHIVGICHNIRIQIDSRGPRVSGLCCNLVTHCVLQFVCLVRQRLFPDQSKLCYHCGVTVRNDHSNSIMYVCPTPRVEYLRQKMHWTRSPSCKISCISILICFLMILASSLEIGWNASLYFSNFFDV